MFSFNIKKTIKRIRESRTIAVKGDLNKAVIKEPAVFDKSINNILEGFQEKWSRDSIIEMMKGINKEEGINEQLINYANQELNKEVQGIEKLITAMMLLGCKDLHGANMGIMKMEDENDEEINVYAKVDTSASLHNLHYIHYFQYINNFKYMLNPSLEGCKVKYEIDYNKLKEEIDKACDLYIENPQYIVLLIHRALFYKEILLKTKEVDLVTALAEQIKTQAKLLKEFANSKEFKCLEEYLAFEYKDYIVWASANSKQINCQHLILYAIENSIQIENKDPSNWVEQNKNYIFVKELLENNKITKTERTIKKHRCYLLEIVTAISDNLYFYTTCPKRAKELAQKQTLKIDENEIDKDHDKKSKITKRVNFLRTCTRSRKNDKMDIIYI